VGRAQGSCAGIDFFLGHALEGIDIEFRERAEDLPTFPRLIEAGSVLITDLPRSTRVGFETGGHLRGLARARTGSGRTRPGSVHDRTSRW